MPTPASAGFYASHMGRAPESALRDAIAEHEGPAHAARALLADPDELVIPWREHMQGYELEVLDRHREGLAGLALLHVASFTVGAMFDRDHVPSARESDDARVNVLRQLWAASLEAGGESLALLRGGYTSGALARWRLVREAEVLTLLIADRPLEVAQSFLDHTSFKSAQIRHDYQAWARSVGEEELGEEEMLAMGRASGRLLEQHPEWRGDYGWAHDAVADLSSRYRSQCDRRKRDRGPTFADIEEAVGQRPSKVFYALGSQAVHIVLNRESLPGTPDPRGIEAPATLLARSLPVPLAGLLFSWPTPEPDDDYVALAELMLALSEEVAEAFNRRDDEAPS